MVTIKIILLGRNNFFACFKHLAAIVTDVETGRHFLLNHPFGSYDETDLRARNPDKALQLYLQSTSNFCVGAITLYSDQSYDAFLEQYARLLPLEFSWISNNCSTVVNMALDFFFPDSSLASLIVAQQLFHHHYPIPGIEILIGLGSYAFSLLDIRTPASVYEKALVLSDSHGLNSLTIDERNALSRGMSTHEPAESEYPLYPDRLDEIVMKKLLRPLSMI